MPPSTHPLIIELVYYFDFNTIDQTFHLFRLWFFLKVKTHPRLFLKMTTLRHGRTRTSVDAIKAVPIRLFRIETFPFPIICKCHSSSFLCQQAVFYKENWKTFLVVKETGVPFFCAVLFLFQTTLSWWGMNDSSTLVYVHFYLSFRTLKRSRQRWHLDSRNPTHIPYRPHSLAYLWLLGNVNGQLYNTNAFRFFSV